MDFQGARIWTFNQIFVRSGDGKETKLKNEAFDYFGLGLGQKERLIRALTRRYFSPMTISYRT